MAGQLWQVVRCEKSEGLVISDKVCCEYCLTWTCGQNVQEYCFLCEEIFSVTLRKTTEVAFAAIQFVFSYVQFAAKDLILEII